MAEEVTDEVVNMSVPPAFVSIEGGRAIAARDVLGAFAKASDSVSIETPNMAGYYLVAWDDQGFMTTAYKAGIRNPYCGALLPDVINQRLLQDLSP